VSLTRRAWQIVAVTVASVTVIYGVAVMSYQAPLPPETPAPPPVSVTEAPPPTTLAPTTDPPPPAPTTTTRRRAPSQPSLPYTETPSQS
jgi:type IV secretory pathway VirB10-like protein